MHVLPCFIATNPLRIASSSGNLSIQADSELGDNKRPAGSNEFEIGLVNLFCLLLMLPDVDPDTFPFQVIIPFTRDQRIGVSHCQMDLGNTGGGDSFGTRWSSPVMRAWLQSNIHYPAAGLLSCLPQSHNLGM